MTKRMKIAIILMSVILCAALASGIGATAAIWTDAGGETGNQSTVGTGFQVNDWNVWAKYFTGVDNGDNNGLSLTGFHADGAGFNDHTMIIPKQVGEKDVVRIGSGLFADVTVKEMIEVLYIPSSVTEIAESAFSALPNLRQVVFEAEGNYSIGAYAFAGCAKLTEVVLSDGTDAKGASGSTTFVVDKNAFIAAGYTW